MFLGILINFQDNIVQNMIIFCINLIFIDKRPLYKAMVIEPVSSILAGRPIRVALCQN